MYTQAEVGDHLDLDQSTVSKLVTEGILPRAAGRGGYDLAECRIRYIRRLREQAAGRIGTDGDALDLVAERARLTAEQADGQAMKNRQSRGELLPKADVLQAGEGFVARCRGRLLAIPSRAAPLVLHMKTAVAIEDMLRRLVNEALAELARIRAVANDLADAGDGGDGERLGDGMDAAADVDGERVGGRAKVSQPRGQRRAG